MDSFFIFDRNIIINEFDPLNFPTYFGKIVLAKIICNKEELSSVKIGILNSVKYLKETFLNYIILEERKKIKIKTLKIENNLIEEGDNMSLFSLGIKSDFTCFVEFEE